MTELMVLLVFLFIFMAVIYGHLIDSYKSRIEYLQEEIKDYQEFILNLLKGGEPDA